jgi:hypothetical protein
MCQRKKDRDKKIGWKDIAAIPWQLIDILQRDFARRVEQIAFFPQSIHHFH